MTSFFPSWLMTPDQNSICISHLVRPPHTCSSHFAQVTIIKELRGSLQIMTLFTTDFSPSFCYVTSHCDPRCKVQYKSRYWAYYSIKNVHSRHDQPVSTTEWHWYSKTVRQLSGSETIQTITGESWKSERVCRVTQTHFLAETFVSDPVTTVRKGTSTPEYKLRSRRTSALGSHHQSFLAGRSLCGNMRRQRCFVPHVNQHCQKNNVFRCLQ